MFMNIIYTQIKLINGDFQHSIKKGQIPVFVKLHFEIFMALLLGCPGVTEVLTYREKVLEVCP